MSTNLMRKLRTSNGFGKMRRSWTLRGSIATLFFVSLAKSSMCKMNHLHRLSVGASVLVLTIEDPATDLRYVVPIRLYGDGADAQSCLAINNVTPVKFRVPTSPGPTVDCLSETKI